MLKVSKFVLLWSIAALMRVLHCSAAAPMDDLIRSGQDMLVANEKSGAADAEKDFQTGALHDILESEKKKTFDCEQLVNKMLSKSENQPTEKMITQEECNLMVEEKLKEIPDKTEREAAKPELQKMCQDIAASAPLAKEEMEKQKLKHVEKCQDLLGGALASVDEASEKTAKLSPEQESCTHDYSFLCPSGWFETGDGSTCEAPASYSGPCSTLGTFGRVAEDKKAAERNCALTWPCLKECDRDYKTLCPLNWTDIGGGKCSASFSYSGRCERVYNFSQLSEKEKDKWAIVCGVNWPCQSPCERDYSANCPLAWIDTGNGVCEAPIQYVGPCGSTENIGGFNEKMKSVFEKKCDALFPCKKTCAQDYTNVCPEGWLLISFQICSPPDSYTGPCNKNENFEGKNEEDKRQFSVRCGVTWRCQEECPRDYTEQCPLEWKKAGEFCLAPKSYSGPCEQNKKFAGYSDDMKAAASSECSVHWPCENEVIVRPMVENGKLFVSKRPSGRKWPRARVQGLSGPIEPDTGLVMGVSA